MLEMAQEQADTLQGEMLLYSLGIYFVMAAVCTTLAVMTLVWMARNEKRWEEFRMVLPGKRRMESADKQPRMVTFPLIFAAILCFVYMILDVVYL